MKHNSEKSKTVICLKFYAMDIEAKLSIYVNERSYFDSKIDNYLNDIIRYF